MRIYQGDPNTGVVTVNHVPLKLKKADKSSDFIQFCWGDDSEGAKQLALAIMVHEFGLDPARHPASHTRFGKAFVFIAPATKSFRMNSDQIRLWAEHQRNQESAGDHSKQPFGLSI